MDRGRQARANIATHRRVGASTFEEIGRLRHRNRFAGASMFSVARKWRSRSTGPRRHFGVELATAASEVAKQGE
jgi:hypothetical protein